MSKRTDETREGGLITAPEGKRIVLHHDWEALGLHSPFTLESEATDE